MKLSIAFLNCICTIKGGPPRAPEFPISRGRRILARVLYGDRIRMSETKPVKAPSGPRIREVPAVSRAIAILRLLGRGQGPMTLKAIAEELGMVTSTCLHILRVLVSEGLVKVDASSKRYS